MPALVVDGVCRYTLHQTFLGHVVANVLDVHISPALIDSDRGDAIADQGKILARQWAADVMPDLVQVLTLDSVSWVDLDSEDGAVGSFEGDGDVTLPHAGGVDNDAAVSNVAILVTKVTNARRGSKQGRIYVCGMPEAYTTKPVPDSISSGFLATLQEDFDDFLTNVNQTSGVVPPIYDSSLCVVHQPASGDPFKSDVTHLGVDSMLATQRRRLRS